MRGLSRLLLAAWLAADVLPVGADEDYVASEERRLEDADDDPPDGARGDWRLRAREVYPPGSTYRAAPASLRHNRYLSTRWRLSAGPVDAAVAVKRAAVGPTLRFGPLWDAGAFKASVGVAADGARPGLRAGDYSLAFGQGLLLYDGFGEFVRPAVVKPRGPRADTGSSAVEHLRGVAVHGRWTDWSYLVFQSRKSLPLPLNPDGSVDFNWDDIHELTGDVQTEADLGNLNSVSETLWGARLEGGGAAGRLGIAGVHGRFSRSVNPAAGTHRDARAFRGTEYRLAGVDASAVRGAWTLSAEAAASRAGEPARTGTAAAATLYHRAGPVREWITAYRYDPDFFSPHGKGPSVVLSGPEAAPRNQEGILLGAEGRFGRWTGRLNASTARFPGSRGSASGDGPRGPSAAHAVLADQTWRAAPEVDARFAWLERGDLRWRSGADRRQRTRRWRAEALWSPEGRWRWSARWDEREESVPSIGERERGRSVSFAARWRRSPSADAHARVYFFDSPKAYLTTGPEEIWDGVVYPRLAGNLGSLRGAPGTRFYIAGRRRWGEALSLWVKWEVSRRPRSDDGRDGEASAPRQAWHIETSGRWGGK